MLAIIVWWNVAYTPDGAVIYTDRNLDARSCLAITYGVTRELWKHERVNVIGGSFNGECRIVVDHTEKNK